MALREHKSDRAHYWEDENGRKQGEYKCWHSNGQLWEHCHYVNGAWHGEAKRWHDNGQLNEHCYFIDGNLHGEYKWWLGDGKLLEHWVYVNGGPLDIYPVGLTDKDKFILTLRYGIEWL